MLFKGKKKSWEEKSKTEKEIEKERKSKSMESKMLKEKVFFFCLSISFLRRGGSEKKKYRVSFFVGGKVEVEGPVIEVRGSEGGSS